MSVLAVLALQQAVQQAAQQAVAAVPLRYPVEAFEARPAEALAKAVFGPDHPFVERRVTRIPGVAQWAGINVDFAARPEPTGYAGLCRYAAGASYFRWQHAHDPRDPEWLELASHARGIRYVLAAATPGRGRADADDAAACRRIGTVFGERGRDLQITIGEDRAVASPAQAAFALDALRAAGRRFAAGACAADGRRCEPPLTIGAFDLRLVHSITLTPCGKRSADRCLTAWIDRGGGAHILRVRAEPARTDRPTAPPRIRSAALSFEYWPVA